MKSLIASADAMKRDPGAAQRLVAARMADYPVAAIQASWSHHRYLAGKVPDLLDVMVEQEQWLARIAARPPRDRQTLARLIDHSLLDEILAEDTDG
jgi:hypothetical protein